MLDQFFDWLITQPPPTWGALAVALAAQLWGTLRIGARSWQLACFLGRCALAWWRKPSRVAVVEQHMTLMRGQFDQLLGALGENVKDAKPNGEPEQPPLWPTIPRDRQHQAKAG